MPRTGVLREVALGVGERNSDLNKLEVSHIRLDHIVLELI